NDRVQLRDIVATASENCRKYLDAKKIRVDNNIPATLPELKVDKPKFSQIFELLFRDEALNLPEGGTVTLSAELVAPAAGTAGSPIIRLVVSDNGPGLPKD